MLLDNLANNTCYMKLLCARRTSIIKFHFRKNIPKWISTHSLGPRLACTNNTRGVDMIIRGLGTQVWAQTLHFDKLVGMLNFMKSNELSSLTEHTFRSLPLYSTVLYLPSSQTL